MIGTNPTDLRSYRTRRFHSLQLDRLMKCGIVVVPGGFVDVTNRSRRDEEMKGLGRRRRIYWSIGPLAERSKGQPRTRGEDIKKVIYPSLW